MSKPFIRTCVAAAFYLAPVYGSALRKRDAIVEPTVDIPIHIDGPSGQYMVPVAMGANNLNFNGTNQQNFNFALSLGTGVSTVASQSCQDCNVANSYNVAESTTARNLNESANVAVLGAAFNGTVIRENCQFQMVNGTPWLYPNQTIVAANSQLNSSTFSGNISGLVGLGTARSPRKSNSTGFQASFSDTIFGGWLSRNPMQSNFTFGLRLAPPALLPYNQTGGSGSPALNADSGTSGGTLHWLHPDDSAYDASQLQFLPVATNTSQDVFPGDGSQPDWTVQINGFIANSAGLTVTQQSVVTTTVDTAYPDIYLPFDTARSINDAIAGSTLQPDLSSIAGAQSQAWTIPCNSQFSFGVFVGDTEYQLDQSSLVLKLSDGTCVSAIEAWSDSTVTTFLLGAVFINKVYLIFNIPRDGPESLGFAPPSSSSKTNVGAIVGGTIGGVAALIVIGLAAFYFLYRRNHRHITRRVEELEENKVAGTVEPFTLASVHSPSQYGGPSESSQYGSQYNYPHSPTSPLTGLLSDPSETLAPPSYEESSSATAVATPALQQARRPEKGGRSERATSMASSMSLGEGPSGASPNPTPTRATFTGMAIVEEPEQ